MYNFLFSARIQRLDPWKQNNSTPSTTPWKTWTPAPMNSGGIFDYDQKKDRLVEVSQLLEDPAVWDDAKRAQDLGRERRSLEAVVLTLEEVTQGIKDARDLFDLAREENDDDTLTSVEADLQNLVQTVEGLEFRRMFSNQMDPNNCFIDIQSGSGGTEAQDWASMLERMYLRYCERRGFGVEIMEESEGEVAGIKSATLKVTGDYAYGYLRTETGVHRLVRKSPFDSGNRRHTSFSSVFVYPEVDDSIEIEINPADLRIDTFRASGAGGQHINKAEAMSMLKARLYEAELRKRNEEKQALEESKSDIGWGHQIRSYVLDQSRIKDLRTGYEVGNTQAVLDGDLDDFISASLKQGV
jgi:peptide chain release factor 2